MSLPDFTMRQLLESGAHFGHQSHRWNPKMAPYIFGVRNSIHIIDLAQTVPLLHQALKVGVGHRRQGRPGAVRRHQAPGGGRDRRSGQALGAVFRQFALARRHADQLEDHLRLDLPAAQARRAARRRRQGPDQERAPDDVARARQAREGARRHQGHGRRPRPGVRHRHQQGGAGDQGGQPAQDPGRRHPRHQFAIPTASPIRSRPTTTPAAPSSSIATCRARRDRRHLAQPGRGGRRRRRGRSADRRGAARAGRRRRAGRPLDARPRPSGSSCSPRRAARPTTSPS